MKLKRLFGFKEKKEPTSFSAHNQDQIIWDYTKSIPLKHKICVDIAASDGVSSSNTYRLFKNGWSGLAVEFTGEKFAKLSSTYKVFDDVRLSRCKVSPVNVISLLEVNEIPQEFGVLSLDIDGYDYFVLDKILASFRPSIICAEINEKIPPPVKFTVTFHKEYFWDTTHFFGQSISQLYLLCEKYKYDLVALEWNDAFLIPTELNNFPALTPKEAYNKGYLQRPDRLKEFYWNEDVEELYSLTPEEAVQYINKLFSKHKGKYQCSL